MLINLFFTNVNKSIFLSRLVCLWLINQIGRIFNWIRLNNFLIFFIFLSNLRLITFEYILCGFSYNLIFLFFLLLHYLFFFLILFFKFNDWLLWMREIYMFYWAYHTFYLLKHLSLFCLRKLIFHRILNYLIFNLLLFFLNLIVTFLIIFYRGSSHLLLSLQ